MTNEVGRFQCGDRVEWLALNDDGRPQRFVGTVLRLHWYPHHYSTGRTYSYDVVTDGQNGSTTLDEVCLTLRCVLDELAAIIR